MEKWNVLAHIGVILAFVYMTWMGIQIWFEDNDSMKEDRWDDPRREDS